MRMVRIWLALCWVWSTLDYKRLFLNLESRNSCIFTQNANQKSRFSIYSQFLSSLCMALHSCKTQWPLLLDTYNYCQECLYILHNLQKNIIWILRGFFFLCFSFRIKTTYQTYIFQATHYFPSLSWVILSLFGMSVCSIFHFFCFPVRKMQTSNHTNSACSAKTPGRKKKYIYK